jgi:DnaJ like chaperone protein
MRWHGKALGALIGFWLGHGPIGALIGLFIGHYFDVQAERGLRASANSRSVQEAFFRSTFQVMGHVAKADGRVSEEEIRAARMVMTQFRLGEAEVRVAIELFTQGKDRDFPLDETVSRLGQLLASRIDLRRMFVQIQLQAAVWAGATSESTRTVLRRISGLLGISEFELAQMEALLRMQQSRGYGSGAYGNPSGNAGSHRSSRDELADAYSVLGVAATVTDSDVTKAYRRLMSQNHPDKLAANGLPESMKAVAEEKTRQIRAAYELIRESRGIK